MTAVDRVTTSMAQFQLEMILSFLLSLAARFSLPVQIGDMSSLRNTGMRNRFDTGDSADLKLSRESGDWRDFAGNVDYSHPLFPPIPNRGSLRSRGSTLSPRSSTKGSGEGRLPDRVLY